MFYKPTIEDARGRRIDLFNGLSWNAAREMLSKEERKAFNEIMKEDFFGKKYPYPIVRFTINIIGIGVMFYFIYWVASSFPRFGLLNTPYAWIGIVFGFVVFASFFASFFARTRLRMKSLNADRPYAITMIGFERCPGCLYSLAELPTETDGCTVCPECGGAWELP